MAVKEAMLYTTEDTKVQCAICAHQCSISENGYGVCRTRQNRDGKLYTLIYSGVSSAHADPIEKKPLYHFFPGSFVFSLGTISCNFRCKHCQNWSISTAKVGEFHMIDLPPEEAVRRARALRCDGFAWTYNEPTIWFEYTYDSAKIGETSWALYCVRDEWVYQ